MVPRGAIAGIMGVTVGVAALTVVLVPRMVVRPIGERVQEC